jgi:hypothetical protein
VKQDSSYSGCLATGILRGGSRGRFKELDLCPLQLSWSSWLKSIQAWAIPKPGTAAKVHSSGTGIDLHSQSCLGTREWVSSLGVDVGLCLSAGALDPAQDGSLEGQTGFPRAKLKVSSDS